MMGSIINNKKEWETYTKKDILYHEVITETEKEKVRENPILPFDELFNFVGEYGKYQKLLVWLIILPACIPCGLQGFNQLFMANELKHFCRIPQILIEKTNFTVEQLRNLAIPSMIESLEAEQSSIQIDSSMLPKGKTIQRSQCFIRDVDWNNLLFVSLEDTKDIGYAPSSSTSSSSTSYGSKDRSLEKVSFNDSVQVSFFHKDYEILIDELESISWKLKPCPNGWDYEDGSSIVKDFDLVCGKEIYPTLALFLANLGGLFGVFIFGLLSDLIGRKSSFFVCLTCEMIGGIGSAFASNFWMWTFCRFFVGLTVPAIYQIPFIICLELVGPTYRTFVTVMTSLFYVAGMVLLPLIAFLEQDWKLLSLYTTVPFLFYFLYIWFLPESIRWLLAQGHHSEAFSLIKKLARVNGTPLPPQSVLNKLGLKNDEKIFRDQRKSNIRRILDGFTIKSKKCSLLDLFRTPNMRMKTLLITLCWFSNCTVYVGLSYYGPNLGENPYLSFFLSSAVEIPGYFLCWLLMDRLGRRWPLCLCMIIGGAFDIATVLLPSDSSILLMCFYLIAKLGISASYLIIYPFAGEIYPTEIRGMALGFSAYIGGIGLSIIPLINYLGRENLVLPLGIMGILSVIGGIAGLRLPETLNSPLTQTIEEGEEFGKDFSWNDCIRCKTDQLKISEEITEESDEENVMFEKEKEESKFSTVFLPMTKLKSIELDEISINQEIEAFKRKNEGKISNRKGENIFSKVELKCPRTSMNNSEIDLIEDDEMIPSTLFEEEHVNLGKLKYVQTNESEDLPCSSSLQEIHQNQVSTRRKRLLKQGSSLEAPTDSTGAFIITPWW